MPHSGQRPKPTLEELLRLKRAERPSPEFWNRFERELHQKQLAALVERRPWWQSLPVLLTRRAYLPIGATAILAFTLVSIKYYTPAQIARTEEPRAPAAATVAEKSAPRAEAVAVQPEISSALVNRAESILPTPSAPASATAPASPASRFAVAEAAELLPWSAPRAAVTPSTQRIEANLASLEPTAPDLASAVNARFHAAPRHQPASVLELASVANSTSPRSRLLAYQYTDRQFAPEPTAPEMVRERLARRLADPEITERFSRVGVQGDRVLVKF